jgi:serine/threonine protein kinase
MSEVHQPSAPTRTHAENGALVSSQDVDRRGSVFGDRFEVGELLGMGGSACVYACKDRGLHDSPAALKMLTACSDDARRRFIDEGRLLSNLRHPHLVQVLAVGETDGVPFIALELLPGESLEDRLRRDGPLPWREVVEMVAQVAGALAVLHQSGVIHRDVKPGNLVHVSSAAGRPLVKLIDLGIAKVERWERVQGGPASPPRHQTDARMVVGTPGFYPPEASLEPPSPRFDTFALGVTIHLLCTAEMPNLVTPRPMSEVRGDAFPPELEVLVATALAVLPEDRIASAGEFQRRLDAIRHAHAEESTPFLFDGCYELIESLGVGAKAQVYRAYQRDAARTVALKILSDRSTRDPEERRRFAREARALGAVSHPALPVLIDCRTGLKRKQPYIAMTLARGRHAGEFCIAGKCLGPADVITIGSQLAGALESMHARGLLHRDVNAANVLIDVSNGTTTAALIDVGMVDFEDAYYAVVQQRYPTPPEARITLGTGGLEHLEWTAPEARATKKWTAKSDVYSLGLLLYKLLTGKRPTKSGSRELVSPRAFVPTCPRVLELALLAALNDDPLKRVDMKELIARLADAAEELTDASASLAMNVSDDDDKPASPSTVSSRDVALPASSGVVAAPSRTMGAGPWRRVGSRSVVFAALGLAALAVAWFGGRRSVTDDHHNQTAIDGTRSEQVSLASTSQEPRPQVASKLPAKVTPAIQSMDSALADVERVVGRCATLAGRVLLVNFTTAPKLDVFAETHLVGDHAPEVRSCVEEVFAQVRFTPTDAQTFTLEYTP